MHPQTGQGPAQGWLVVSLLVPGFLPYLLLSQRANGWSLTGGPPEYVITWVLFPETLWQLLTLSMRGKKKLTVKEN